MDAVVVDQDALHFEIGLFAGGLVFVLDECVLQGVSGAFVTDDFTGEDFAESTEY